MLSVPSLYIKNIAGPILARFENEATSIELAFSACVLIAHFADVLAEHTTRKLSDVRTEISSLDRNFDVVHAFSIAAKHVLVSNPRLGRYIGLRSEDAEIYGSAAFSDGTYFSDGTTFSDHPDVIRIKTPNGSWHDLLFAARSVVKALKEKYG